MSFSGLWHIQIRVHHEGVASVVNLLESIHMQAVSWLECDDAKPSHVKDSLGFSIAEEFLVEGYTSTKPDLTWFDEKLFHVYLLHNLPTQPRLTMLRVNSNEDWLATCYKAMPAMRIGRYHVCGTHLVESQKPCRNTLVIDAATAFGSGDHPTTKGCLKTLDTLACSHGFHTILDMGCGSGILAIAAKKTWAQARVVAADYDKESVIVTNRNAQLNKCSLETFESFGFNNVKSHQKYDLILANILARPLVSISPHVSKFTTAQAFVVLSGLLVKQIPLVLSAYQHQGFSLYMKTIYDGWATLCLRNYK
jgi:ribosomal protein L11 methyltransferase